MNIQQALQYGDQQLAATSPSARRDAQVLLGHVLQCNSAYLFTWPEKKLTNEQLATYQSLIQQRQHGTPVAHLTGKREFWSLNLNVNNSTLIPRPETETLIEFILTKFNAKKNLKLIDMGTGTGAIAIALATEKSQWNIFACDISEQAIQLAALNSQQHQTDNIRFIQSDWFNNIADDDFDIIVSNPPYIANDDLHLSQGDVRFEPKRALTAGDAGMDAIEYLCLHAKQHLRDDGYLIVEHGYDQQSAVNDCFARNNYTEIEQQQDLSGHTRMTVGKI